MHKNFSSLILLMIEQEKKIERRTEDIISTEEAKGWQRSSVAPPILYFLVFVVCKAQTCPYEEIY